MCDHPYQLVQSSDYFRGVLGNMGGRHDGFTVRFGQTGDGTHPHYQIEDRNGANPRRFRGDNHKPFHDKPRQSFDPDRLSEPVTFGGVQELLRRCLDKRS